MAKLHMDGPLRTWHETAYAATWVEGPVRQPVMVFLGPEGGAIPGPEAQQWVGMDAPGLLPLQRIVPIRRRWATVYPRPQALGLIHLVPKQDGDGLPMRCAAEVVAQVARTLSELGPRGLEHTGPALHDLGIDEQGVIHLRGFVPLWPKDARMEDPRKGRPSEQLVWRLGLLLAALVGGRPPSLDSPKQHAAGLRRILIRAMSRKGAALTERFRDYLVGMLAWEPADRPPLSTLAKGLQAVAENTAGPDLATWAAAEIPRRMAQLAQADTRSPEATPLDRPPVEPSMTEGLPPLPKTGTQTLPGVDLMALKDEQTVEAGHLPPARTEADRARQEPGIIPVTVGPPAEALKQRPTLPPGFLTEVKAEVKGTPNATRAALWILVATLAGIGVMLLALLLILWFRF